MTAEITLKAPKAKGGRITVTEDDGIHGDFLRTGQHPYCVGISPTVMTSNKLWVVVRR